LNSSKKKNIRKLIAVLFIAALLTSLISISAPGSLAAEEAVVRVKLSVGKVTQFNFSLNGNYGIKESPNFVLPSGSYSVKAGGGTLSLYSGAALLYTGTDINIREYKPSGEYNYATLRTTKYGSNDYLGDIEFRYNSGSIDVINHVYLEYYLYGVVPHEMSNTWPLEALKTQAVAARTYAKRYMNGSGSYDVVDTAANQVYKGFNPGNANAIRAVDETARTVLVCDGELAQTFFAASNGGYVDIPQHVWSSGAALKPYHIIQEDPYDTQNTWSLQEVLIFPKVMEGSGGIRYKYSSSGSMVAGTGGEAANAERYLKMSALPAVAAKGYIASVTGDIEIIGISRMAAHTYDNTCGQHHDIKDYNGQNACVDFTEADVTMTVLAKRNATQEEQEQTGEAFVQEQVTVDFTIDMHEFDKTGGLYTAFRQSQTTLRLLTIEETENCWNLYHRRYGHGVGMSQRGAQTRAKAGQTYRQILLFYYPNTTLQVLNIAPRVLIDAPDVTNAVVVNCTYGVNVRSTPNTDHPPIGNLPPGARITVTQAYAAPEWHKVYFGGADAYIYAYYVKLDPAPASPETPSATESTLPSDAVSETPTSTVSVSPTGVISAEPTETSAPSTSSIPAPIVTATPAPAVPVPIPTPSIACTGTVTAGYVNIRSGPGTSYKKFGTITRGSSVYVIAIEPVKDWHMIWYNNHPAYIWADYTKLSGTLPAVQTTGTVTASILNVRSGPGTSYGKLGKLLKGDRVEITNVEYTSNWHQIIYGGGLAYVHASYISIASQGGSGGTGPVYASINANKLNFRTAPGTNSAVICTLSRGDIVQVLEKGAQWYKVKYGGREGYMYASYLKIISAVYGKVNTSYLNVRSGASSYTSLIGRLDGGTTVQILETGTKWHKIRYGSSSGYVFAAYIDIQ
jgi:stage II sporulation protein D